jgi:hypothetical protein
MIERQLGKEISTSGLRTETSKLIIETISDHLEDLCCANISDDQAYEELDSIVQSVNHWIRKCSDSRDLVTSPNSTPSLLRRTSSQVNCETTWDELLSTEETIWCPTLGIRGQVDILVSGNIRESGNFPHTNDGCCSSFMIPVELKTGKWRLESLPGHRAQIILYIVMILIREGLSWRNKGHRCVGLLLYLGSSRESETKWEVISPSWSEIRALIQVRNTLAYHLNNGQSESGLTSTLPPLLRNRTCESCFQAAECLMYHLSHEKGTEGTSGVPTLFQYLTQHVTPSQRNYFLHWDQLISLESNLTEQNPLSSLWISDQEADQLSLVVTSISKSTSALCDFGNLDLDGSTFVTFSSLNLLTADLRNLQSFHCGDLVHVTAVTRRTGDGGLDDIEDFRNISNVDPFVASGTVLSVSRNESLLAFKQMTSRFKRCVCCVCQVDSFDL